MWQVCRGEYDKHRRSRSWVNCDYPADRQGNLSPALVVYSATDSSSPENRSSSCPDTDQISSTMMMPPPIGSSVLKVRTTVEPSRVFCLGYVSFDLNSEPHRCAVVSISHCSFSRLQSHGRPPPPQRWQKTQRIGEIPLRGHILRRFHFQALQRQFFPR